MQVSLKSDKNNGYFTLRPIYIIFVIISCSILLRMRNVLEKRRDYQNTHFVFSNYFQKQCCLWDKVEKCYTARQTTDDNRTHHMQIACCVPKATNTPSEHTSCFSTATMVA